METGLESSSVGRVALSRVLLQAGSRQVSYPGTFLGGGGFPSTGKE